MPGTPSATRRTPLARKLLHLLIVGVGWVGFAWLWMLVASRPWESHTLVWLIAGSLIVIPVLTGAWVLHNRALYRRKGERKAVPAVDARYEADWYGRRVHADWAALRRSQCIVVSVDGGHKHYRTAPVRPAGADASGRTAGSVDRLA